MTGIELVPQLTQPTACHECSDITVYTCPRCHKPTCVVCRSDFDPQYCRSCMADVQVKDEIHTRTETDWNEKTDTMTTTTSRCRQLSFAGADWVWHSKRIATLSDADLKAQFEYHRATVAQMEMEITSRNVKRSQQAYSLPGRNTVTVSKKVQTSTVKTTRTTKAINLDAIAAALKKLNLSPEQIAVLFPQKAAGE